MTDPSTDPIIANAVTTGITANNLQCSDTGHSSVAHYINTSLAQKFKHLTIEDEAKLERFIANAVGSLIQLVDRHWELLAAGLQGDLVDIIGTLQQASPSKLPLSSSSWAYARTLLWKFKAFLWALATATIAIFIRSVFRVAELSRGFHGPLGNQEVTYIVLEGVMVLTASISLTAFHPGPAFGGQWQATDFKLAGKENTLESVPDSGAEMDNKGAQALVVDLSEQLYQKSTHFLSELIQNADDNSYDVPIPTLNLTYSDGGLRVDSNEVGFTASDVEALCKIGRSTKVGVGHSTRYIGEKGIGFKSVFQAADVVWVSSGGYSFKFDKSEPLGMIVPIWAEFPAKIIGGHTSFYMKFSHGYGQQELIHHLRSLDPRMLIFLRRLRRMNLKVIKDKRIWETTFSRTDVYNDNELTTSLRQDDICFQYLIRKHTVDSLPPEPKRVGCSQSVILLAFPQTHSTQPPELVTQSVYAFLPIRDYGFTGDFLLTANRQDIDSSSHWNHTLLDATVDAFLSAIEYFNSGTLRYKWLHYVPGARSPDFFKKLQSDIMKKLSEALVLECCNGTMCKPTSLKYVPRFTDDGGIPYTLGSHTEHKYLSLNYPLWDSWETGPACALGVKELTPGEFLQDLATVILRDASTFRNRPRRWHSDLAKILLALIVRDEHKLIISALDIIPLRDGNWVSAQGRTIFFSEMTNDLKIPEGIPVMFVDPEAEASSDTRNLFAQLGVRLWEATEICRLIRDLHADPSFNPALLSRKQLVSHAEFLFKAPRQVPDNSELCGIFEQLELQYQFLHTDYYDAIPPQQRLSWIIWLCDNFNLSRLPRLISPGLGSSFNLSDDFKFILGKCESSDVLLLLRNNWDYYKTWIEEKEWDEKSPEYRASKGKVRDRLAGIDVKCRMGKFPLGRTFLPLIDVDMDEIHGLPVLDIQDPKDQRWQVLVNFGTAVKKDIQFYLLCLENMQGSNPSVEDISSIYRKLQFKCSENGELIRKVFKEKPLIYTQYAGNGGWITAQEFMHKKTHLEAEYPHSKLLFRCIFMTEDTEINTLQHDDSCYRSSTQESDSGYGRSLPGITPRHGPSTQESDSGFGTSILDSNDSAAIQSTTEPYLPTNETLGKDGSESLYQKQDIDSRSENSQVSEAQKYYLGDDLRSVVSDLDEINSQASTRRSRQEVLAEEHLAILLAQHQDLQPLFQDALKIIDEKRFVDNMRRLLKRFYLALSLKAKTNLEHAAAQLLRSRWSRIRLAQNILDRFSPQKQEHTTLQVSEIQLQVQDLEDWIANNAGLSSNLENPVNVNAPLPIYTESEGEDGSDADGDDEDEFEQPKSLPNIDEMENFLLRGTPFQDLSANICFFLLPASLNSLTRVLRSVPQDRVWFSEEEDSSLTNKLKTLIEDATEENWNWWPLRPRMKRLQKEQTRVHWICHCGTHMWTELSKTHAETYKILLKSDMDKPKHGHLCRPRIANNLKFKSTVLGWIAAASSTSTGANPQNTSVSNVSQTPQTAQLDSSRAVSKSGSPTSAPDLGNNTHQGVQINVTESTNKKSFVLFGVQGGRRTLELAQINISTNTDDCIFFKDLRATYRKHRGFWRYWLSIWQMRYCDFVKFKKVDADRVIFHKRDLPHDMLYEYAPRPPDAELPPILPHEFELALAACGQNCLLASLHDCIGPRHGRFALDRIPKRRAALELNMSTIEPAWGIQAQFSISAALIMFYHFLVFAGAFGFWGWWEANHPVITFQVAIVPQMIVGRIAAGIGNGINTATALTKLTTFQLLAFKPKLRKDFDAFMGNMMGARKYWVDWHPVQERILEGFDKEGEAPLIVDMRSAMKPGYSLLLLHEMIIPETGASGFHAMLDLTMMVLNGVERLRKTKITEKRSSLLAKGGLSRSLIIGFDGTDSETGACEKKKVDSANAGSSNFGNFLCTLEFSTTQRF
ncbi:hypothetical protein G7Y89_g6486 [Cudoniella acicularis]|uniref:Protein NO VEIN C-terminal domain-containing protein n=1 Tax=Cudoniella acicularis TaxID=354080 RepID=A0A8H4W2Y9_9HELO|nr:hypothetical protein G7Y89_g6486 [Cudoniella acicularis]